MHEPEDDDDESGGQVRAAVGSLSEFAESTVPKTDAPAPTPLVDLVHEIEVEFNGKPYKITSVVPTVEDNIEIGKLCGAKSNPVPFNVLPPETQALIQYIALITRCTRNRPKWLDDCLNARLAAPIFEIGREVARHHELWFLATQGVDSQGQPRSVVAVKNRLGKVLPAAKPG